MPNNYKKSFNFRNGVQVDDDNFIINANGLVGIGTSSPTEILDVYGTVKVTGVITATQVTSPTLSATKVINVGVTSITSGIISATTGLVTYYGDGGKLLNIPTSQWIDVNPGLGITSIYAAGNVGIATTSPVFTFQVGPNPLVVSSGIGINSTGNVYTAGVVTALSFSGIGSNLASLNASNISSGTISTSVFPSNIGVSGTITALAFSGSGAGVTSLNASNITSGTISTSVFPSNIGVSGTITALAFVGNLTGTATTATNLAPSGTISITSVNSGFSSTGIATITQNLYVVGFPAKIGVGTVSAPEADVEVNKLGISSIRVISSNNVATIGIGRSAEIRTGNLNVGSYPYSTANSLDIINSNPGNLNYYLDYGSAGLGTGNFNWIYGQDSFNPRMTLTYDGKLGIGITNPTTKLSVVGTSYFSSTSTFDGSLFVTGSGTSITGNDIYGSSFVKTGGTSSQFLKADGTTDSNTYLNATGNGSSLSGIVTSLVAGSGISIDSSTGRITVSSNTTNYWTETGGTGITTTSGVGVGTIVPITTFQVKTFGVETGFGTFIASAGVTTFIDNFNPAFNNFKSIEYTLHLENGNNIQSQKVLAMQNGTTAYSQEYAVMYEPNLIVSVGATISSGEFRLNVTPETGISGLTTYRFVRQTLL